jgi:cell division GTPase FtsZ
MQSEKFNFDQMRAEDYFRGGSPAAARIKVIGVGGAGGNAVNRMIQAKIEG